MRHRNQGPKLNRSPAHRKALGANLATALLTHGRIQTTAPKARLARGIAERAITLAKEDTPHAPAGDRPAAQQGGHLPALRHDRAGLQRRPGRLHPHPEAGPPPGRRRRNGAPRADPRHRGGHGGLMPGRVLRLDLEYDGAGFSGWAAQPGLRTVEGELRRALGTLLRGPFELASPAHRRRRPRLGPGGQRGHRQRPGAAARAGGPGRPPARRPQRPRGVRGAAGVRRAATPARAGTSTACRGRRPRCAGAGARPSGPARPRRRPDDGARRVVGRHDSRSRPPAPSTSLRPHRHACAWGRAATSWC